MRACTYQKTKKQVGRAQHYYSIANYQTKIPATFQGHLESVAAFEYLYSTILVTLDA
jgi:hypothetical protein